MRAISLLACFGVCVATAAAELGTVSPIVKCTVQLGEDLCAARWGYYNPGPPVFVPHGAKNGFSQRAVFDPIDNPPVKFETGRHELLFQTVWSCRVGPLKWTVDAGRARSATALNRRSCGCGQGCLEGLIISPAMGERFVNYEMIGQGCNVSHFVLDLDGCQPNLPGSADAGPCAPAYDHPFKIESAGGNLTFDVSVAFRLGEMTVKGGQECDACETFVPVCPPLVTATSMASSSSTTITTITSSTSTSTSTSIAATTSTESPRSTTTSTSTRPFVVPTINLPTLDLPPTRGIETIPDEKEPPAPPSLSPPIGGEGADGGSPPKNVNRGRISAGGWAFISISIVVGAIAVVCSWAAIVYTLNRRHNKGE
jgi:hypothetical protein